MTDRSAAEILERFRDEQAYIERYVDYLEGVSLVSSADIRRIAGILRRHGIADLPERTDVSRWAEPYEAEELTEFVESAQVSFAELVKRIDEKSTTLAALSEPNDLSTIDARSFVGEWIESALEYFREVSPDEAADQVRAAISAYNDQTFTEYGEQATFVSPDDEEYILEAARFINARRELSELHYAQDRLHELDLSSRLGRHDTELSTLRQGFILLLTAFDAAVFDLVRVALKRNFFGLIQHFGKGEKVSLEAIGRFGSFDAFRDAQIEEQLKRRYLKDLLFLLSDLKVVLIADTTAGTFGQLIELVMRRNVHVHNRGVIDERYLERDQTGTPRYNVYGLSLGEKASITPEYWKRAAALCAAAGAGIAQWAEISMAGAP